MFSKIEILTKDKERRIYEVEEYQVNIDNYRIALQLLAERNDPDMVDFEQQLKHLLQSSLIEQKKSQTLLDAINKQLES